MIDIALFWQKYGELISAGGGIVGGWYGRLLVLKAQLVRAQVLEREQLLRSTVLANAREKALSDEIDRLRQRQWQGFDAVEAVYAEAIAVRLIVHDMDAAAGRPMRMFRPLPPYPFADEEPPKGGT
ncbi:hypothetical protein AZ09_04110 [Acetobacter aceti 1023]|nr:hypothetical protein AZ09_04110 [Acetobacter aceti 1023]